MGFFDLLRENSARGVVSQVAGIDPETSHWVVERIHQLREESVDLFDLVEECRPFAEGLPAEPKIEAEELAKELLAASRMPPDDWRALMRFVLAMA